MFLAWNPQITRKMEEMYRENWTVFGINLILLFIKKGVFFNKKTADLSLYTWYIQALFMQHKSTFSSYNIGFYSVI